MRVRVKPILLALLAAVLVLLLFVGASPRPLLALRASVASEPRERSEPAKRRARERVGESEGRSPSELVDRGRLRQHVIEAPVVVDARDHRGDHRDPQRDGAKHEKLLQVMLAEDEQQDRRHL